MSASFRHKQCFGACRWGFEPRPYLSDTSLRRHPTKNSIIRKWFGPGGAGSHDFLILVLWGFSFISKSQEVSYLLTLSSKSAVSLQIEITFWLLYSGGISTVTFICLLQGTGSHLGVILPPTRCLGALLVVTLVRGWVLLVSGDQGCCRTSHHVQDSPHSREVSGPKCQQC